MSSFDAESGLFLTDSAGPVPFLPDEPANTPPYELVSTSEVDAASPDGFKHYLIGGDDKVVKQIIGFYKKRGKKVPDGYAEEAAAHAERVKAAQS